MPLAVFDNMLVENRTLKSSAIRMNADYAKLDCKCTGYYLKLSEIENENFWKRLIRLFKGVK